MPTPTTRHGDHGHTPMARDIVQLPHAECPCCGWPYVLEVDVIAATTPPADLRVIQLRGNLLSLYAAMNAESFGCWLTFCAEYEVSESRPWECGKLRRFLVTSWGDWYEANERPA